jgi:outer membrane protein TolC
VSKLYGQTSLTDFIKLAQTESYTVQSAKLQHQTAEFNYKLFRSNYRPALFFNGNVPVYNKDNFEVRQPDGSVKFLNRSQNSSNIGFSFAQPISATGGTVSLNTDLYRFDDFIAGTKQYSGTPVYIRLQQPLFAFNKYKWDIQTEPIKLKEAATAYQLVNRQAAFEICKLFFDIAEAKANERLAEMNIRDAATNIEAEKRRLQLGVTTEDKVLQLEVRNLNDAQQLIESSAGVRRAVTALLFYLGRSDSFPVNISLPETIPPVSADKKSILAKAKENSLTALSNHRKTIEAAAGLANAKLTGRQVTLTASFGLNNAASTLPAVYENPNTQQRFSIGFSFPVIDGGKRRLNIELAMLDDKKRKRTAKNDEMNLLRETNELIEQLFISKSKIETAKRLDTIAAKRYVITNRLFQLGKTSVLELQAATLDKDNAHRNYISALRRFWETYYLLQWKSNSDLD